MQSGKYERLPGLTASWCGSVSMSLLLRGPSPCRGQERDEHDPIVMASVAGSCGGRPIARIARPAGSVTA